MMVQRTTDAGGRPRAAISVSLRLFPLVALYGHWRAGIKRDAFGNKPLLSVGHAT